MYTYVLEFLCVYTFLCMYTSLRVYTFLGVYRFLPVYSFWCFMPKQVASLVQPRWNSSSRVASVSPTSESPRRVGSPKRVLMRHRKNSTLAESSDDDLCVKSKLSHLADLLGSSRFIVPKVVVEGDVSPKLRAYMRANEAAACSQVTVCSLSPPKEATACSLPDPTVCVSKRVCTAKLCVHPTDVVRPVTPRAHTSHSRPVHALVSVLRQAENFLTAHAFRQILLYVPQKELSGNRVQSVYLLTNVLHRWLVSVVFSNPQKNLRNSLRLLMGYQILASAVLHTRIRNMSTVMLRLAVSGVSEEVVHEGVAHEGVAHEGVAHEGVAHEGVADERVAHEREEVVTRESYFLQENTAEHQGGKPVAHVAGEKPVAHVKREVADEEPAERSLEVAQANAYDEFDAQSENTVAHESWVPLLSSRRNRDVFEEDF